MVVHRAVSAGVERPTKSWQARFLPLADPAAEALERLQARGDYTSREDYVFCSRLGRRLDPSAVRRRFKAARDAAGLRALRFHALRHAAPADWRHRRLAVRVMPRPSDAIPTIRFLDVEAAETRAVLRNEIGTSCLAPSSTSPAGARGARLEGKRCCRCLLSHG
jgi:hypothetical protein